MRDKTNFLSIALKNLEGNILSVSEQISSNAKSLIATGYKRKKVNKTTNTMSEEYIYIFEPFSFNNTKEPTLSSLDTFLSHKYQTVTSNIKSISSTDRFTCYLMVDWKSPFLKALPPIPLSIEISLNNYLLTIKIFARKQSEGVISFDQLKNLTDAIHQSFEEYDPQSQIKINPQFFPIDHSKVAMKDCLNDIESAQIYVAKLIEGRPEDFTDASSVHGRPYFTALPLFQIKKGQTLNLSKKDDTNKNENKSTTQPPAISSENKSQSPAQNKHPASSESSSGSTESKEKKESQSTDSKSDKSASAPDNDDFYPPRPVGNPKKDKDPKKPKDSKEENVTTIVVLKEKSTGDKIKTFFKKVGHFFNSHKKKIGVGALLVGVGVGLFFVPVVGPFLTGALTFLIAKIGFDLTIGACIAAGITLFAAGTGLGKLVKIDRTASKKSAGEVIESFVVIKDEKSELAENANSAQSSKEVESALPMKAIPQDEDEEENKEKKAPPLVRDREIRKELPSCWQMLTACLPSVGFFKHKKGNIPDPNPSHTINNQPR